MSEHRRGLGRGLGALIPTAPAARRQSTPDQGPSPVDVLIPGRSMTEPAAGDGSAIPAGPLRSAVPVGEADRVPPDGWAEPPAAYFTEIPLDAVTPNPRQPRQVFDEEAMTELAHSISEVGLLQPVVVRPLGEDRFELVMGERRWRAAREAQLTAIPAIVRAAGDDAMLRDALLENLHRSQLNPLEEAAAYDQMLQDFGCTHEDLANRLGRSRPQISNTLRLLKLPPLVQRRVAAGVLSAGHARALLGLDHGGAQERLAQRIVAEGLSVRTVEEIVAVGEGGTPERRPRSRRPVAPALEALAGRLSDRFETRVKVDLGRSKGRIVVEFGSIDDLERIVRLIAPSEVAALAARDLAGAPSDREPGGGAA